MGFVEIQFSDTKFLALLETLASIAPNPFPTFDFLPKDQLIRSVKFGGQPAFGPPSGLTQTPGTLLISLPVTINHVSIDQLEAKPNDAGTDVSATLWAEVLMVDGASVAATVVRVDVGKQHHTLPVPISLTSQAVSVPLDGITIHKGGLLRDADRKIVVVRLAMSAGSAKSLLSTPVMDQVDGQDWAIFIDPNVLTSLTLDQFEASLAEQLTPKDAPMPFPDGIVTEDAPAVVWTIMPDGSWGMTIVVGFLAIDACPTLIGDDVNMSVGVTAKVEVTPNIEKQRFDLKLHITHNVSDWDSLRCGLQNLLAGLLLSLTDPFLTAIWDGVVGPFAAALVVTAMPQLAEYMAGGIVADQDFGNEQFEKLNKPEGDDDATYTGTLPMPMFPGGTIESAVVDVFGLTVRGSGPLLLQGLHQMTITPSIVSGGWDDGYSCSTFSWVTGDYVCMPVSVTDTVRVLNTPVAHPKVILFGTTEARPKKKWKAELNLMAAEVTVVPKTTPEVATDGKLWVHSSAGLASVPIAKVGKRRAAPTGAELVSMKTGCTKAGNEWAPGHFNVKWLVDPPPTEAVVDVLRQWVLQA
ncbi:MAG TPA: hypothetical protein VFR51_01980, partial [Pyrinomonadaceae bacterium]|nr:hypothetical protein [Pyrinomonadaceae bacterium]